LTLVLSFSRRVARVAFLDPSSKSPTVVEEYFYVGIQIERKVGEGG
jgi:hypothetical protein